MNQLTAETGRPKFFDPGEFHLSRLLPSLLAGTVAGVIAVSSVLSFALLIFSGELAPLVPAGVGMVLFSGLVVSGIVALASSAPGIIASPQDGPAPIFALMAATVASATAAGSQAENSTSTVLSAIALTTVVAGIFFYSLGKFKLGRMIRFIPYPVIGGIMAGTGWLMLIGAVATMTDRAVTPDSLPSLFDWKVILRWLPGMVFALALTVNLRLKSHFLILPGYIVAGFVIFFVVLLLSGITLEEASSAGLLLQAHESSGMLWRPVTPAVLALTDWRIVFNSSGFIVTILVVSLVQFLLYLGGLELAIKRDMDINRELKASGLANILCGFGGGVIGCPWPGISFMAHEMKAANRMTGIFTSLVFLIALLFGASLISFLPRPLLGGLLAFFGFAFLGQWLYDGWFRLSRSDYCIVLLILAVIGAAGFLPGVAVGLIAAVILFVVNYSRIDVVKHVLTGRTFQSNLDRPPEHRKLLREVGEGLHILKLQGYIFFGTADRLLHQVRCRANDRLSEPLRFAVLDFSRAPALDSSALFSFVRMKQLAEERGFVLVFTQLSQNIWKQFERGGFSDEPAVSFRLFPDLDYGVEWCEDQLLAREKAIMVEETRTLAEQLTPQFSTAEVVARLTAYLEKKEADVGFKLIRQGETAGEIYFIESGRVTVYLELEGDQKLRLRSMGAGSVVGEMGMYLNLERSATVVTDRPSVLYRLRKDKLERMNYQDPALAGEFHQFIVRLLSERLVATNISLKALLE
ncbi:MAG TPA: SulP family inorganic anion transporter [archaeon]|nr:SulP family inorganic anion transporter [archaeon]